MSKKILITIITSFYNSSNFINSYQKTILDQDFSKTFEIIMVNDGSTDDSVQKIKKLNLKNLRLFSLKKNYGPSRGRNLAIKKAKGDYIFFLDIDDTMEKNTLSTLYKKAINSRVDFIFCDTKWIENSNNQREGIYSYSKDKIIKNSEITTVMINRLYNPQQTPAMVTAKGRLIKRLLLISKKILFEEKLKYLEDEIFNWDLLAHVKRAQYVKKQLYCYHTHPEIPSGIISSVQFMFNISKFKIIIEHIKKSLIVRGVSETIAKKHGNQALIFFIINLLISNSKSMFQKKINFKVGKSNQKKIIKTILTSKEIEKGIPQYSIVEGENLLIPKAIYLKKKKILQIESDKRAKEILYLRSKKRYI